MSDPGGADRGRRDDHGAVWHDLADVGLPAVDEDRVRHDLADVGLPAVDEDRVLCHASDAQVGVPVDQDGPCAHGLQTHLPVGDDDDLLLVGRRTCPLERRGAGVVQRHRAHPEAPPPAEDDVPQDAAGQTQLAVAGQDHGAGCDVEHPHTELGSSRSRRRRGVMTTRIPRPRRVRPMSGWPGPGPPGGRPPNRASARCRRARLAFRRARWSTRRPARSSPSRWRKAGRSPEQRVEGVRVAGQEEDRVPLIRGAPAGRGDLVGIHGASEKYAITSKSNRTRASTGSTDPGTVQTPAERATQRLPSRLDDPAA